MSTVVAVRKGNVVAIGADTLTTYGGTREAAGYVAHPSKIVRVGGDSLIAYVGHASWGLILRSYFAGLKRAPDLKSTQGIFEMARHLHKSLKDDYFLSEGSEEEDDEFESSRLECLIVNDAGIFALDSLRFVQEHLRFVSLGTGYRFALGAMHGIYDTDTDAETIARAGVNAGAEFDTGSGLPAEVFTVALRSA